MGYSHTWDPAKSSLTVYDKSVDMMADLVRKAFVEAGKTLKVAEY